MPKRERWREADLDALPTGEHDYFERKSGQIFGATDQLLGTLTKAISAFANSGGGHLVLGVADDGTPDGVPLQMGSTSVKDWLEQKVPNLFSYPLADFRVHIVEPATPTRIPAGRAVVVIDIGDSALAPHQSAYGGGDASKGGYYYRQAGHSVAAPHFYLELLRQRLVAPQLTANSIGLSCFAVKPFESGLLVALRVGMRVRNGGRVAAYNYHVYVTAVEGATLDVRHNYWFGRWNFPVRSGNEGISIDDRTLLPGLSRTEELDFAVRFSADPSADAIAGQVATLLVPLQLKVQIATEVSPGAPEPVALSPLINVAELTEAIRSRISTPR